jgi:hypothetical protein
MKKEGATDQAGEDGEGYVDEFLFHVLSLKDAPRRGRDGHEYFLMKLRSWRTCLFAHFC